MTCNQREQLFRLIEDFLSRCRRRREAVTDAELAEALQTFSEWYAGAGTTVELAGGGEQP